MTGKSELEKRKGRKIGKQAETKGKKKKRKKRDQNGVEWKT